MEYDKTIEDDVWSDEEVYHTFTQEELCGPITSGQKLENDSETTDSEDFPLADLGRKLKQSVKRKLIQSDSELEHDDSADDEDYVPNKDDINSTDSEYDVKKREKKTRMEPLKMKTQGEMSRKNSPKKFKIRQHTNIKRASQSEMAKKLREKIRLLQSRRKATSVAVTDVNRAKQISKRVYTIQALIRKAHLSRLDTLLASNELRRVSINGDGNCFFASVKKSGNIVESASEIRANVCDFMTAIAGKYISFCTRKDLFSKEEFLNELDLLKTTGQWNLEIADIVPLAIANYFGSIVRIYSSSISTPVIDIKPEQTTDKVINLAYIAVRGQEHYDAIDIISNDGYATRDTNTSANSTLGVDESPAATSIDESGHTDISVESTPHKRASYKSPPKKHSSRKKTKNPAKWKRNVRKSLKSEGKEYVSAAGKVVASKKVRIHSCVKCRFKCSEKFTEEQREDVLKLYYSLGSYERQRQYLCDMVERNTPKRKGKGKKSMLQQFYMIHNNRKERVCRDFFMKTLDIKRKTIDYTLRNKNHGAFVGTDMRGKSSSINKLDSDTVNIVKKHIESFPKMESHYTRKTSKKQYLAHDLNIKQMWKLYTKDCEKKEITSVKQSMYRKIFCENYNLSFFKPKKDQCSLCTLYDRRKVAGTVNEALQHEYDEHKVQKERAREEKAKDKERAKTDRSVYVATFDLQAVLTTPCSLVSELYYSRKLCCFNLTIYSLGDKQAVCHVWDETQCKRGSCEIATCLMKNTLSVCQRSNVKEIIYFSDTCGGQKRNQYVTASLLYSISQVPNLRMISHKFLLSGHSQMECDSVHSTIEGAKRITPVYVPSQWCTLISLARKSQPYVTVPMKYNHVIDFKDFVKKNCTNLKTSVTGQRINWLKVKWIQVRRDSQRSVFVNYSFDSNQFHEIHVQKTTRRQKDRHNTWPTCEADLKRCYDKKLPISIQKKNDLVELCSKEIIPEEFHTYYESLPTSKNEKDCVPMESDEDDTDME